MAEFFTTPTIIMIIVAAVLLPLLAIVLAIRGGNSPDARKKKVASTLKGYAGIRNYKVLNNVVLKQGSQELVADHILVGFFGLLIVSDLVLDGDYYGELNDATWVCNTPVKEKEVSRRIGTVANPMEHNRQCLEAVRTLFAHNGIYNLQMDSLVVVAWPKPTMVITGSKDKVVNLKGLRSFLGKDRFSRDNGLDVDKLTALLEGAAE